MNFIKKIRSIVILILIVSMLTSCSKAKSNDAEQSETLNTSSDIQDSDEIQSETDAQITSSVTSNETPENPSKSGASVNSDSNNTSSNSKKLSFVYNISSSYTWNDFIKEIKENGGYPLYIQYIEKYINGELVVNGKNPKVTIGKTPDYEYSVYENGKACINKYIGNERNVVVPGKISGYEVFAVNFNAFSGDSYFGNKTIESIDFPDSVRFLIGNVCEKCYALEKVKLPKDLITIGNGCFNSCWSLTEITLGNNLREIGKAAFYWCKNLSQVNFGKNLVMIETFSFAECYKLKTMRLPDSVKYIGTEAFLYSENLSDINCPKSLEVVYIDSFEGTKIDIEEFNTKNIKVVENTNLTDINRTNYIKNIMYGFYQ